MARLEVDYKKGTKVVVQQKGKLVPSGVKGTMRMKTKSGKPIFNPGKVRKIHFGTDFSQTTQARVACGVVERGPAIIVSDATKVTCLNCLKRLRIEEREANAKETQPNGVS